MSNHIHVIASAEDGSELSSIVRDFKSFTAKEIINSIEFNKEESRREWMLKLFVYYAKFNKNNSTYQFWQRGNHPVELATDKWIAQKLDYIHMNPVRARLVDKAEDYVYSSARNYSGTDGKMKVDVIDFSLLG